MKNAPPGSPGFTLFNWILFCILSIIWGSSFALMKIGLHQLSPYEVASLRLFSAGLVLLPFSFRAIGKFKGKLKALAVLSGLLGSFIPAFLFCIAETRIDSSLAGILNALTPLFTLLVGVSFYNMKIARNRWLGVLVGLLGLVMLGFASPGGIRFGAVWFSLLVVLATLMYAVNVNMVSHYLLGVGSLEIAAVAFSFLSLPAGLILWQQGFFNTQRWTPEFGQSAAAVATLGVMGTAIANVWFYTLVKRAGTLFGALVTYGIPFVAIVWGLFMGEEVRLAQVACLGVILLGVWLVNRKV